MRNKKGEAELIFLFVVTLLIIGFFSAIGNTDYKEYMEDCEKLNKVDFYHNTTCNLWWEEDNYYECEKVNWDGLKSFCQDKWDGNYALSGGDE